ncbi:uncharacterized protein N7498_004096 [Penicillium cinerascens]|uniref:Uncharacterized protein n=1 Tax=Penicillium cinerascens TaxID=70096 RepID=A0A9W9T8H7_9EURO|nr:uncharacterized protein N7498_004096 [Penicillium cinerascens]KAJ5212450.1 hypothetical protein N7498_004096 [Penicillium cinerascens]
MVKYDIAMRTLVITMKALSIVPLTISAMTDMPTRTINTIWDRAIERGFDPLWRPLVITDAYIAGTSRSGRPKKQTPKLEATVLAKVRRDRYGREKTCADIAGELSNISAMTV